MNTEEGRFRMFDNRIPNIRSSTVKAFSLGIITGSMLTAGVVLLASPARADGVLDDSEADYAVTYHSAICAVIDQYHSINGVLGVAKGITEDGFTTDSAVDIINSAVNEYCPRNWPLLVAIGNAARGTTA